MASNQIELKTEGITMPRIAVFYDLMVAVFTLGREKRFRREIIEIAGISSGDRVLDAGCGTGTLAIMVSEVTGPEGEVLGVDATLQMISRARKKADRKKADVRFEAGLVEAIPSGDSCFDHVLTTFTMHHFPGDLQIRALAEMHRVLTSGGQLVIVDFPHGHNHGRSSDEKQDAMNDLIDRVKSAGFVDIRSGPVSMMKAAYVLGLKP